MISKIVIIAEGDLYALLGAASFAISSAIIKRMNKLGDVIQLNFLRTLIGAIIFIIHFVLFIDFNLINDISGLILFYLIISVILNIVIGDTAFFESQNKLGVKIAMPIVNTYPYFTIILAIIFLNEFITIEVILGSLILIPGIIFLSVDRAEKEDKNLNLNNNKDKIFDEDKIKGLIYVMIAVLCYSLGMLFTTVGTVNIDPILANSIRVPVATVGLLFLMRVSNTSKVNKNNFEIGFEQNFNPFSWSNKYRILMLLSGVLGTYFSSLFLVLSVQEIGASRSAILFSTGPFFSLPIAIYWLKEKLSYFTIIGTIMTIIGLWVILI
tara:strand:+ start:3273 stop:4247 length:975 start_codon:yes stop_codon:yes gene_type:complete